MNIKNLFIEFITLPSVVSIIGILSFISAVVALIVAWRAYQLQRKSDKDLKKIEKNIDNLNKEGQKIQKNIVKIYKISSEMRENIEKISKISSEMQTNVNKSYFQIERTTALNKYPEREEFKKINEAYQNFIFPLFDDEKPIIGIIINPNNPHENLQYEIEVVKNERNIPKKEGISPLSFYLIQIISPANAEVLTEAKMDKYKQSPIKEGEYYGCRFDEGQCSWILGQRLSIGTEKEEFFNFYHFGSSSEAVSVPSANEIMRFNTGLNIKNYPGSEYTLLDQFFIDQNGNFPAKSGNLFKLFKRENQIFFIIKDSPLKEIYVLKTWIHTKSKKFLVFENLRGHIKNEDFIENFKNKILEKINWNDLPEKSMDINNYEKNYHIKIPLENS